MIKIESTVIKKQKNFWNACVFHPTDAIEDPWGRRILDQTAADGAIRTVRIYAMLEDVVYLDAEGGLCYDFRLTDLRLDYLLDAGFIPMISYAGIPDCISVSTANKTSVSKNKTRYKGKLWNSSPPKDFALWEEICFEYTRHIVDRYGLARVKEWRLQCFNEPDLPSFFFSEQPNTDEARLAYRLPAYCEMYAAFVRGTCRVSDALCIGGPSLAGKLDFFGGFLDYVRERGLRLDFASVHNYGTAPKYLNEGSRPLSIQNNLKKQRAFREVLQAHGFAELPLLVDEWGMSASGFCNCEECPALVVRETEVFPAYFVKLVRAMIDDDPHVEMLAICLSGQHEMTEDFTGFRNFFSLNFIKKPIYNAHVLLSRLGEELLAYESDGQAVVIPTRDEAGHYAVAVSYSSERFEEDIPAYEETVCFSEDLSGRAVSVYAIDRAHTNPYRLYERMGKRALDDEDLRVLRREGTLSPLPIVPKNGKISLPMTPNCTYLITVE